MNPRTGAGAASPTSMYPHLMKSGPAAAVWAILDTVVDDYVPACSKASRKTSRTSSARCSPARKTFTEQIYMLKEEINDVYRAVHPLLGPFRTSSSAGASNL